MKRIMVLTAVLFLCALAVQAQETSRVIPFSNVATNLPASTTQGVTAQLWDAAANGNLLFF